jgi:hypothetical protein
MYKEWVVVRSQGGYESIDSSFDDRKEAQRRAEWLDLNNDAVQMAWAFRRDTLADERRGGRELLEGKSVRIPRG